MAPGRAAEALQEVMDALKALRESGSAPIRKAEDLFVHSLSIVVNAYRFGGCSSGQLHNLEMIRDQINNLGRGSKG